MNKKLPKVFATKINKDLNNNDKFFYSRNNIKEKKANSNTKNGKNSKIKDVNSTIKDIFNSPNYVYKMKVEITMKDGQKINKAIIGKLGDKLITLDEELIPIDDIKTITY